MCRIHLHFQPCMHRAYTVPISGPVAAQWVYSCLLLTAAAMGDDSKFSSCAFLPTLTLFSATCDPAQVSSASPAACMLSSWHPCIDISQCAEETIGLGHW